MFLGFRPFNWKVLVRFINQRVWSPNHRPHKLLWMLWFDEKSISNVYFTTTFEYPMLLPPPNNFDRHSDISVTTQKSGSIQPPQKASGQILLSFFPSLWLSDGSSIPKAQVLEVLPSKNWLKALVYSTKIFSSFSDKIWALNKNYLKLWKSIKYSK